MKRALVEDDRRVQLFVPDLAIEVVSKNDPFGSVVRKARRYIHYGTQEVWVFLISSREVYYYSKDHDRILREHQMFDSALIPGFQVPLAELFDWN